MKRLVIFVFIMSLLIPCLAQEQEKVTDETVKQEATAPPQVQAWQLPTHMKEGLLAIQAQYEQKIIEYKVWLIGNVKKFEDMPANVILLPGYWIFVTPESKQQLVDLQAEEVKKKGG